MSHLSAVSSFPFFGAAYGTGRSFFDHRETERGWGVGAEGAVLGGKVETRLFGVHLAWGCLDLHRVV